MYVRVSGLIIKHNKILVMGYEYPGGYLWHLPGGKVQNGEALPDALRRELYEELKISVDVQDALFVCEEDEPSPMAHVVFKAQIISGEPIVQKENSKARQVDYLFLNEISNLYPNIIDALANYHPGEKVDMVYLGKCRRREWV